ncbi:MAG: HU family DNA-binding protein [Paludibacteraceae bacterium]|nr:HU family DNA-binding protein [Paludibacteraceae bacterium]
MESKKISLQELTDTIVAQSGVTKRFTESFLRELVQVIQEYLEKDGVVKVKGLGTFKLIWNEPRKSVDVSTGTSIVLPGHYKVTFTPDAEVKEKINAPYSHLDTVMGAAEILTPAEELEDDLDEPEIEEPLVVEPEVQESVAVEPEVIVQPIAEDPIAEEPEAKEEPVVVPFKVKENEVDTPTVAEEPKEVAPTPNTETPVAPKRRKWWVAVVIIMLLALLGAAGFYWRNVIVPQRNVMPPTAIKSPVVVVRVDTIDEVIADTLAIDSVMQQPDTVVVPVKELTLENYTYQDALNAPVREMVTVIDGSRLTMIALRAYGHKAFWVYVYDANRNVLNSPNAVEKGMQLVIPDLPLSIVNPKSRLCIEKASELAKQY